MRKIPALLLVLGVAALSLTGCVSVGAADCSRPAAPDSAVQSQVTVTGAPDAQPKVEVSTPMHVTTASAWDVTTGSGTPITGKDQLVVLDVALYDGTSGGQLVSTPFDGDLSRVFAMSQWSQTFPDFDKLLHCATPGSRVVMTLPPDGIAKEAAQSLGVGADISTVVVVDVGKTYLTRATGPTVFNDAHDMPTVVRAPSGQPGIIVPDTTAPKDVVVQTLVRGDGAALKADDFARVNYTGVPWEQGADVFGTTWDTTPASVSVSAATQPGFTEALKGQTVGSQVLVVVPADKVGASADTTIPSGKALVYVIDILGVDAAAPATTP